MLKNKILKLAVLFIALQFPFIANAQLTGGQVHGSFQLDAQYYLEDSTIGSPFVEEGMLLNAFGEFTYTNGGFTAGVRFETYLNPLQGIDDRYEGSGFPYKFASYKKDEFSVTVGNFYEQFGSGLTLRTYQDAFLGMDNSIEGVNVSYAPVDGIHLKGLIGKQRYFWDVGPAIVRGFDAEFDVKKLIKKMSKSKLNMIVGGSFVSKYQDDDHPVYILPENVANMAARMSLAYKKVNFSTEYAYKINDPSASNGNIYKPGQALVMSASYSQKGLGVLLNAKYIDNMDFRSDRYATGQPLMINYIPAYNKQHTYSLAAMYPYASQPLGETGLQAQVTYTIPKKTKIGGKYGTTITLNASLNNSIGQTELHDSTFMGYEANILDIGEEVYFRDYNIEIKRKFNKKWKMVLIYLHQEYNTEVIEGHTGEPNIVSDIAIADITYKFNMKNSLRFEAQHLWTVEDDGNWMSLALEYTLAPRWFFTVMNEYNYGNPIASKKVHYPSAQFGFNKNATRIAIGYGKRREGIYCVGGVCRSVPASNGVTLSIISSF